MTTENDIISDADIALITGYEKPVRQCKALEKAGVWFVVRRDGRPCTTWTHFNNPLKHRGAPPVGSEPDWGAME
ncbi:DUF4224 domain-containing protein [Erwinia psidii]|uniref:DUF4224 domain-containing protein n=1 Tax=Erwinia psidii TaxID=69224 RepID=UPI00226B988F|nr:DUF4224 domain-containing protein [Erwinia psidii]MCX8958353.1 DUF4224 domain-containing protein [Erwinia psidii]